MAEDKLLDDLDKKFTPEYLRKLHKINLLKKIQAGETGLIHELEALNRLDEKKPPPANDELGIPARLRIPRHSYTMTEAALRQRKQAAQSGKKADAMRGNKNSWKHGKYAKGFIERFIRPCKSSCKQYPCELIGSGEAKPGGACLDKTEILTTFAAIKKALTEKSNPERYSDINEIIAMKTAGAMQVVEMLLEDILTDNTIIKSEKIDSQGKVFGYDIKLHPSLLALPKMLQDLGITLHDLHITPKAIAKAGETEEAGKTLADILSAAGKNLRKED